MKTRFLILYAFLFFVAVTTFTSNSDAMRMIWPMEQMVERSDVIVVGMVESTWLDVRPFEDYKIVNTATIRVDEWLKNKQDSDKLEIRYYGDWSQKIENLLGIHRGDTPVHSYSPGERVLVLASYEKPTKVMGEGYYPFYEGKHVIQDKVAVSQIGEQVQLDVLREFITSTLGAESPTLKEKSESDKQISKESSPPIRFCAYIGFEKYPDNLFAEFLDNPYNKDVTFLNFTDSDLKQIPEFHEMMLEASQLEYPLNDRVRFTVSPEEYNAITNHLEQRTYSEFNKKGETLLHQIGKNDLDGNYRFPQILMNGKLYGVNGLKSSQVFSDRDVHVSIEYNGTIEEAKKRLVEDTNPNRANLIFFEITTSDRKSLGVVLDAIDKIQKSKDKIRMSEDVGGKIQHKVQDFFVEQNNIQFDDDNSKHTRYFLLNGTLYETSFVIC